MSSDPSPHKLHHVGFVVPSIEQVIESFCQSIGGSGWSRTWHDPIQRVSVAFIYDAQSIGPSVELIEPAEGQSPVRKFLEAGGGLHHLCYEVADIDTVLKHAAGRGLTILRRPQPAVAFDGRRIAWLLTKEKLLMEYLEA
ncbi:MAG: VOC family protein [Acidobacteriaceae bacterium]|nr:VOC family protein [Acidobacteriaceae bacterium]